MSEVHAQNQSVQQLLQQLEQTINAAQVSAATGPTPQEQELMNEFKRVATDMDAIHSSQGTDKSAAQDLIYAIQQLIGSKGTINSDGSITADPSSLFGQLQASTAQPDKDLCSLVTKGLDDLNGVYGSQSLLAAAFSGNFQNTMNEAGLYCENANYSTFTTDAGNVSSFTGAGK
jgi:hypothetical protein